MDGGLARRTAVRVPTDAQGQMSLSPNRQDSLAYGHSQLLYYAPMFGYALERFPLGALHPGPALASNAGVLNIKNPACYVFPGANGCAPGDPFRRHGLRKSPPQPKQAAMQRRTAEAQSPHCSITQV